MGAYVWFSLSLLLGSVPLYDGYVMPGTCSRRTASLSEELVMAAGCKSGGGGNCLKSAPVNRIYVMESVGNIHSFSLYGSSNIGRLNKLGLEFDF